MAVINKNRGQGVFNVFNVCFMIALMIVTFYPILHVVCASFSDSYKLMAHRGILLMPLGFNTESYNTVLKNTTVYRGYLNTTFILVVGVCINIFLTSLGAYFLSRKGVMWRNAIMFLIIFTMFFNGGIIPFYLLIKQLGLFNNLWSLILPGAINTFNLIVMRTAFASIPDSIEESAKLDGANHLVILFLIILPLSLPTVAVLVLYYGVGHWNAWFNAMLFIRNRALYPLQLILNEILINSNTDSMTIDASAGDRESVSETIKYAIIVVSTLPILLIYPFLQKYFVKGVMVGAIKG